MAWCFEDERSEVADVVLDGLKRSEALVPAVWPLEVVNVLLVAERRGRLERADSARFLSLLASLPIVVESMMTARAFGEILALARDMDLSSYDAAYLDLAMREGIPLATFDERLRGAAERAGVPVVGSSDPSNR
jgi:predicted nucleic acid-binding protein